MEDWQDWVDVQWSYFPKPRIKLRVSLVSNAGASDEAVVNPPNPQVPSSKQSASSPSPSTEQIKSISSW
ncbi:uncharacterized protein LOC143232773 isoform X2 [Tachypleus tridentatus]|uniref:uncharacterized protein LOC143232773 isoform X2 n=1 Tax=Tachypleus tridentatus TaxID=6853 RepID=UPI003FD3615E